MRLFLAAVLTITAVQFLCRGDADGAAICTVGLGFIGALYVLELVVGFVAVKVCGVK